MSDSVYIDTTAVATYDSTFNVVAQSFADLQLLRYQVPGFDSFPYSKNNLHIIYQKLRLQGVIFITIKKVSMAS